MNKIIVLSIVMLMGLSGFCQPSDSVDVWKEVRGDDTLIVMTQSKGKEIAHKLVNRKELQDSVDVLLIRIVVSDSLQSTLEREISFLSEDLKLADQSIDIKDQQIVNHVEIQDILQKQLRREKRKKVLWAMMGSAGGVATGIMIGVIIK